MHDSFTSIISSQLENIKKQNGLRNERLITTPQNPTVCLNDGREMLIFCANNYLGLSNDPFVIKTATEAMQRWGFGLSSVRFICGTQTLHKDLEKAVTAFLGTDDTILYSSCFDANTGLFETLLGAEDAIISDELNHASIVDGIRLCKARRLRYRNRGMDDLENCLKNASGARMRLIATDGVFSMDGSYAPLDKICELANRYNAAVMVDDSHGIGVAGPRGRGTVEMFNMTSKVDIITGTFGKALGGASGGFTSGRKAIIDLLRQRSRPYLFSNTLAPSIAAATLAVLQRISTSNDLLEKLKSNTSYFKKNMRQHGFDIPEGDHPIVPIMLGDAALAQQTADALLNEGIFVVGFSYPVVPQGKARIRVQISAVHTREMLDRAIDAFVRHVLKK